MAKASPPTKSSFNSSSPWAPTERTPSNMNNPSVTQTASTIVPLSRVEPSPARKARANMFKKYSALAVLLLAIVPAQAANKINVMTATEDLAALAREVGGDFVTVDSIAKGYQDPHFVESKPSFLLKLQTADLLVAGVLQLEIGWLPPLITQSRNAKIQPAQSGYMEMSQFCNILEIPQGQVTRAMGDVHPLGNPHRSEEHTSELQSRQYLVCRL